MINKDWKKLDNTPFDLNFELLKMFDNLKNYHEKWKERALKHYSVYRFVELWDKSNLEEAYHIIQATTYIYKRLKKMNYMHKKKIGYILNSFLEKWEFDELDHILQLVDTSYEDVKICYIPDQSNKIDKILRKKDDDEIKELNFD